MKDLHHSCQGESHIATNKVCQDASYSATDTTMSIAIVCDGHGGARYFRSDVGAKFAVDATKECVDEFVSEIDKGIFVGKSLHKRNQYLLKPNQIFYPKTQLRIRLFANYFLP